MPYQKNSSPIGIIERILKLPCAPSPEVWIGLSAAAALKAWGSILEPDPKEIYHMVAGKSLACHLKTFMDDAHEMNESGSPLVRQFVNDSIEAVDLTVWYAFIASTFADAFVNYTSQYIRMHCASKAAADGMFSGGPWFGGLDNNTWESASFIQYKADGSTVVRPASVSVRPKQHFALAAHATWVKAHESVTINSIQSRLRNTTIGYDLDFESTDGSTGDYRAGAFYGSHNPHPIECTYEIQWLVDATSTWAGTQALLHDGHLSCYP